MRWTIVAPNRAKALLDPCLILELHISRTVPAEPPAPASHQRDAPEGNGPRMASCAASCAARFDARAASHSAAC